MRKAEMMRVAIFMAENAVLVAKGEKWAVA